MDDVFPKMNGFETHTQFMQKRVLLEFVMIKYVIEGTRNIPLETILNDADISTKNNTDIGYLLQAVSHNKIIFLAHQDLYNLTMISHTLHLDVTIECDPFFIAKWINLANNTPDIYSFEHTTSSIRKVLIDELNEKITSMKKIIDANQK